jgi:PAS domain S-box-containing protein
MSRKTKSQLEAELLEAETQIARLERALRKVETGPQEKADTPVQLDERFSRLLDILPVGVSILNSEKKVIFSNHTLQNILQLTEAGLAGGVYQSRQYLAADGSAMTADGFASAQAAKIREPVYNVETGILKDDGETIWTSVSAVPVSFTDWSTVIVTSDITHRKQAEDRLAESESRFATIFESSPIAMGISDLRDGKLTDVNAAFVNLYGYTREESIGHTPMELGIWATPADRQRFVDQLQAQGSVRNLELVARLKSGDERSVLVSGEKVEINGRPCLLAQIQDITELRWIEDKLRESEKRYTLLFQKSTTPVLLVKLPEVVITDANEAAEKLTGYMRDEMLGRNAAEIGLISHAQRAETITQFEKEKTLAGNEMRIITKSGEERLVVVNTNPLEIGEKPFALTSMQDVTERKRAEQAMRQSEELFRVAIEFLPIPIAVADTTGRILRFNQRFTESYGYTVQDLPTIDDWMLQAYPEPEYRAKVSEDWNRRISDSLEKDLPTPVREFNVTCKDGSQRMVEIINRGVQGLILASFNDITDRKQAEISLRESRARLDAALESMTDAVFISDTAGNFIHFNEAFATFHKFKNKADCAKTLAEYPGFLDVYMDNGELAPLDMWAVPRALRGEIVTNAEYALHRKDTDESWVGSYSFAPIRDPNGFVIGSVVVGRDISERKRAEQELRQSRELFQALFNLSPVAYSLSKDGAIVDINPACEDLYGYSKAEVAGRRVADLDFWMDPNESLKATAQFYREGKLRDFEFAYKSTSGRWGWAIAYANLIDQGGEKYVLSEFVDITERKKAEIALQVGEKRISQTLESIQDGFFAVDENWRITYLNQRAARNANMAPQDANGRDLWEAFPRILGTAHETNYRKAMQEQLPLEFEMEGVMTSSSYNIRVYPNPTGKGISVYWIDNTEKKKAQQELLLKSEQLREQAELLEHAHVLVRDMENRIVTWNQGMEKLYGWTKEEAIGQVTHTFLQTQFPEPFGAFQAALMQNGYWEGELTHIRKDGAKITVSSHQSLYHDQNGQPVLILEVNNDITGRKLAEDALRLSDENFARAFRTNPSGLAITRNADGKFILVNEAYTSIMGYSPAEILGHDVREFSIYPDPREREHLLQKLAEQGKVLNYELAVRPKGFDLREILVSMEPLLYNNEDCILSAFVDITERKQMEDELRRSNADLEQFAYIASHDLQEPLRAVAGMVQLLQKRYQGQLDDRADEYISHAVEAAARMQALIQGLLTYSRVERRNQPIEPVDAGACLQTALKNLDVSIRESHAVIETEPLPTVQADPVQLTQLFQNLIGNGIKFRGGNEPQIQISATRLKAAWQFSVRDNGIGIEPQYFERIFLIFQRLHTRREYSGTGIGLALCKKIIERHGGLIWVESEPGRGSTFHFTLPLRSHP